jgi:hypothetical protein
MSHFTWRELKDEGTSHFESHRFEQAAECWSRAYQLLSTLQQQEEATGGSLDGATLLFHQQERQYLLSNLVACQLRILEESQDPSVTQAQSIVSLAKECVQLNDQWAKAHVRLASAYLALDTLLQTKSDSGASTGRIHSNDACLSLQTALRLDHVSEGII